MKNIPLLSVRTLVALKQASVAANDGVTRLLYLPLGHYAGEASSGAFEVTVEKSGFDAAKAAYDADATPTKGLCDYDHKALEENGDTRASGWIQGFEWDETSGVIALVKWTPVATQAIEDGEYKFLSPVFAVDKETKLLKGLSGLTLTNEPFFKQLQAVAAMALPVLPAELGAGEKGKKELESGKPNTAVRATEENGSSAKELAMSDILTELRRICKLPDTSQKWEVMESLGKLIDVSIMPDAQAKAQAVTQALSMVACKAGVDVAATAAPEAQATAIVARLDQVAAMTSERDQAKADLVALKAADDTTVGELTALRATHATAQDKLLDGELAALVGKKILPCELVALKAIAQSDRPKFDALMQARPENAVPLSGQKLPDAATIAAASGSGGDGTASQIVQLVAAKAKELRKESPRLEELAVQARAFEAVKAERPDLFTPATPAA